VLPGLERVGIEEAPDRAAAHRRGVGVGRDQARQIGGTVATERLLALRGQFTRQRLDHRDLPEGKRGLAPAPWLIGQAEARRGPGMPPPPDPVGMLPEPPRGGTVVEGGVGVEEQGQLGTGDRELRGVMLANEPFAVGQLLRGEGRAVRRTRPRHEGTPSPRPRQSGPATTSLPAHPYPAKYLRTRPLSLREEVLHERHGRLRVLLH
jgi:hypothetical protein